MSAVLKRAEDMSTADLAAMAWKIGDLRYKLSARQREIFDLFKRELWGTGGYARPNGKQRRAILKLCRRFGKSFLCAVLACELCATLPDARVYWAAETSKQVKRIILPIMRVVLKDCPKELRPRWMAADGCWKWPNGSEIHVAGCENEEAATRLRGDYANLFILDEAGHITPLKFVYRSIALFMTARVRGRIIMPSSPAKSPGHAFTEFAQMAEAGIRGAYAHRDVYQSDLTPEDIEELKEECGGEDSADWQREGLALDVVDEERAIIPEFTKLESRIVRIVERPRYFAPVTWMDVGFHPDLTAVLFGYWHPAEAVLVIEDELAINQMTTDQLAAELRAKEAEMWGAYWAQLLEDGVIESEEDATPYQRVSDIAPQLLHDLAELHGLSFMPVHKASGTGDRRFVQATVNKVRMIVRGVEIAIHPRCKQLIAHLKAGIWNKTRTSWERLDGFGHFDFIDALRYGVHHLDRQYDPTPAVLPEEESATKHLSAATRAARVRERNGGSSDLDDVLNGEW